MSAAVLYLSTALGVETCCTCGISFGMPESYQRQRREDQKSFFCPSGHTQSYRGETEAQKLQKQLDAKDRALQWEREAKERAHKRADTAERKASAARGQVTKIRNRVGNGVCPCCNRTFVNLQRHMGTQHPDFKNEGAS